MICSLLVLLLLNGENVGAGRPSITVSVDTSRGSSSSAAEQPYVASFGVSSTGYLWEERAARHWQDEAGGVNSIDQVAFVDSVGLTEKEMNQLLPEIMEYQFRPRVYPIPFVAGSYKEQLSALRYFEEASSYNIGKYLKRKLPFLMVALCQCERDAMISQALLEYDVSLDQSENYLAARAMSYLLVSPEWIKKFDLMKVFRLTEQDLPTILIDNIPVGPNVEKFKLQKFEQRLTKEDIEAFIMKFRNSELELVVRSQPVPEQKPGSHVVQVVGSTFKDVVMASGKNVFVLVYSRSCSASIAAQEVLEHLGEDVSRNPGDYKNVLIAKMEATKNDFPFRGMRINHFPMAFFFPADGKNSEQVWKILDWDDYNGIKQAHEHHRDHSHYEMEMIKKFIQQNSA